MALKCRCICGCKLLVASDSAGKRIKCPKCERKLRVPVDVVEKRRAQLDARKPGATTPPQRSRIAQPLSALLDLPEPEPPPIQLSANERLTPAIAPVYSKLAQPESSPATRLDETDVSRKPPPLPKRSADQAATRTEPPEREPPPAPSAEPIAAAPLPAANTATFQSSPEAKTSDVEPVPRHANQDVELTVRGYEPDRKHVATVRWLAAAILLTGLIGTIPAFIDIVEHMLSESSEGLSRWACALLLVGLLQCAYAVYLVQLPDWSSVWVVTIFTLAIAASYAAMFGLTLLSSDQGQFVQLLDLADRLRGGKATGWCLIMLSLTSLTSYFSGHVGARWRNAFVG